ncbi:MAG: hypothetical protein EU541_05490 [Promethearchaeota archaeon]|nr:MAG: hypothetical protein EU541_05490 [Candidatus Lokiarchaeota archaeon]
MANKKLIAGGIIATIIISTITIVGLIPVIMYGSGETLTEIQLGMTTDGTSPSSSLSTSSIQTSQVTWSPNLGTPEVIKRNLNAYETFFRELGGEAKTRIENQRDAFSSYTSDIINLSIYITFNLTTPSNQSVVFEFNPQNLNAQGLDIVLTLDSDDLNGTTGEFFLEITISITLDIDLPDPTPDIHYEHEFSPISKSFIV